MKINLTKKQVEVIVECLDEVWNCYDDVPFYDGDGIKDSIRKRLIKKLKEKTE